MLMPTYAWRLTSIKHILMEILLERLPVPSRLPVGSVLALAVLNGDAVIPRFAMPDSLKRGGRKAHDWAAKDDELLRRLMKAHAEIRSELLQRQNISRTMLMRRASCVGLIRGRPEMLPKSIQFIDAVLKRDYSTSMLGGE
jgi:hypothetical protein